MIDHDAAYDLEHLSENYLFLSIPYYGFCFITLIFLPLYFFWHSKKGKRFALAFIFILIGLSLLTTFFVYKAGLLGVAVGFFSLAFAGPTSVILLISSLVFWVRRKI